MPDRPPARGPVSTPLVDADPFACLAELVYHKLGVRIPATKRRSLGGKIRARACSLGLVGAGPDDEASRAHALSVYLRALRGRGESEWHWLVDLVTVQESSFFRMPAQFEWMAETVFRGPGRRPPRIWSAACATGEEPYSLAILATENRAQGGPGADLVASDASITALERARQGVYQERSTTRVDPSRRSAHFTRVGQRWEVSPDLRDLVRFEQHNLLDRPQMGSFDCVLLRNVLIYFDAESRQRTIDRIMGAITIGGLLVVGPTEGVSEQPGLRRIRPFAYERVKRS